MEQLFLAIVLGLGLSASRPVGDSCCYDAIVESRDGRRLSRVQVKSVSVGDHRSIHAYRVPCWRKGMIPYKVRQIEYIAAYVIPDDAWYVIPVRILRGGREVYLKPCDPKSRFAKYRDAWHLLF